MKSKFSSALFLSLAILVGSDALALTIDAQTLINLSIKQISYGTDKISVTYNNNSTAVFTVTSTKVTWSSDHLVKTTTYLTTDKSTYSSVTVVAAPQQPVITAGTNANGAQKTTVATYGDGYVLTTSYKDGLQTITDNKGAAPKTATVQGVVTWSSDHLTKTTTYSFADGTQNPILTTVLPTQQGVAYTAPSYTNLSTTGAVTKPSVTPLTNLYGDGTTITLEAGTTSSPFNQSTLSALNITDPNAIVKAPSSTIYDLTWGTPDKAGPSYATLFAAGSYTFSNNFTMMGHTISGQCPLGPYYGYCLNGATLGAPLSEVLDAWKQGWTGKGINILMIDGYSATNGKFIYGGDSHGLTTMGIASRYAFGATMYGLDFSINSSSLLPTGTIKNFVGNQPTSGVFVGVINASFGANYISLVGHKGNSITSSDINYVFQGTLPNVTTWSRLFDGTTIFPNYILTDAVITKSAGNDSITSEKESYVYGYAVNSKISPRLLIVGALDKAGTTTNQATIATYSNTAGTNIQIQNRFLVASGTVPFATGALSVDGQPITADGNTGTSYAAPRVAGYAAIVRQKFPNLTGAKTADILLQTARYDTLTCNPNCDKSIYGQGEASLSRALAPVGRLK